MKDVVGKILPSLLVLLMATMLACQDDDNGGPDDGPKSIAVVTETDPRFSTLADALERTGLMEDVRDENAQLTLFAPNNAAFESAFQTVGVSDLDGMETVWGIEGLKRVLLYHLLNRELEVLDLTNEYRNTMATNDTGHALSLYTNVTMGVMINAAPQVVDADIDATNGIVHEINAVLLPQTVLGLLEANPDFSVLVEALAAAGDQLDTLFNSAHDRGFTVFAPDDAAFTSLFADNGVADLDEFIDSAGTSSLTEILKYHAVDSILRSDNITNGTVATMEGSNITFSTTGGISLTDRTGQEHDVTNADIQGTNGVIHRIEAVLKPQ